MNALRRYLVETTRFKQQLGLVPKGFHYLGAEDYVLDRGTEHPSAPLTLAEWEILLAAVQASRVNRFRLGECYYNSQMLVASDSTCQLNYCEGFAIGNVSLPVAHGWVTLNGKVIDLTWRTVSRRGSGRFRDRILGELPPDWSYYGVSFTAEMVIARIMRMKATASFLDDIYNGYPLFREPRIRPVEALLG